MRLTWLAPDFDGGSPVTGYRVEAQTGTQWSAVDSTTEEQFTMRGEGGRLYQFRVVTSNDTGGSEPSEAVKVTVIDTPGAPRGLNAIGEPNDWLAASEIYLGWSPPFDGGSPITEFVVERSADGRSWETVGETTGLSLTDTGLTPGTFYTYRVTAVNAVGASPPSPTARAAATEAPVLPTTNALFDTAKAPVLFTEVPVDGTPAFGAPTAPTGVRVVAAPAEQLLGTGDLLISWTPPGDEGDSSVIGYLVERSRDGTAWERVEQPESGHTLWVIDEGLVPGVPYAYRVSAVNGAGAVHRPR